MSQHRKCKMLIFRAVATPVPKVYPIPFQPIPTHPNMLKTSELRQEVRTSPGTDKLLRKYEMILLPRMFLCNNHLDEQTNPKVQNARIFLRHEIVKGS